MDVDEPTHLELVADDFEEGEHDRLDGLIKRIFPILTPENLDAVAPFILCSIADKSGDRSLPKYQYFSECEALINSYPSIRNMIFIGSKKGYRDVRLLKILRPEPPLKYDEHLHAMNLPTAAELGWQDEYVGDAANALWDHVQTCFRKSSQFGWSVPRYSAIVQSSGMGKSRVVDEMSRSHFVIPVNLRQPKSSGYPPSDKQAYDYLVNSRSQEEAYLRSCSFLHALFLQTADVVKGFQGSSTATTAAKFRDYMTDGMKFRVHGENRTKFHEAVETKAKSLYAQKYMDPKLFREDFPLDEAFQTLFKALEAAPKNWSVDVESPLKQQKMDTKSQSSDHPLVVLVFDDVHTLTEPTDVGWSRFGEIRRALRALKHESLYTLFLSTSGTLLLVTPTPRRDISARTISTRDVVLPFYELGFDQLAVHVNFPEPVSLSQVTSEEHFTSYGRPLWRPYYQKWKSEVVNFAAAKLLGGVEYNGQTLSNEQKLACLSQRIPIEFLSIYISPITDVEKEQVNSHMRVILEVDDSLETMVTTSPSEPVLSEAASLIMSTNPSFSPPQTLQTILGFAVNKGELGELLVALLFTIARDMAVGPADNSTKQRWCSITGLLQSLFCTPCPASENHVDVIASHGWHFTPDGTEPFASTLADTFKDSKVYFTHFIKVHQHGVVEAEFLMRLMVRGAAVLCGENQFASGIDGIIPFLLKGDEIKPDNIGVIVFQVKNDSNFTHEPRAGHVRKMDPHRDPEIISSAGIPIVRLFFALAADTATLKLVHHDSSYKTQNSYSTYDFWVAGLSPELLVPVMKEEKAWDSILNASSRWKRNYSGNSALSQKLRMSMNPGAAVGNEFWQNWCDVPE